MLNLLSECHFWTIRDDVRIKATDLGAFRYVRNRELQSQQQQQQQQELAAMAKRDYTTRRNGMAVLKNSRKTTGRLKDNIKKLEELLRMHKIVYSQWKDAAQVLLLFANGIIAHISIDIYTGDILRMVYEKYLVGKLAAELITDAFFTRSHIVLAYNTNQLTVVYLQKPNMRLQGPEKIANMEPRIFHVIIPGPAERKLARHLSVNSSFDLFVIWTKSSQNEVYPWRPTIRDQDRANIHVFKLKSMQLESISYCWSENDPLCVDFLRSSESQILTVEQKVSRKGDISAEICSYEINAGKMQRSTITSIVMGTQICSYAFSPDQEKLFVGTIDRNICLHDLVLQTTKFVAQIDIIPSQCSWHCDSSIVMIANDRSQFQCFDLALTPIGNQLQSEDVTPLNLLDLSHYFSIQPTLLNISFSRKPDLANFTYTYAQTDCFLLLLFENGPIGCLRFFAGAGMHGDIHNSGLTTDVIIDKYLAINQLEKATNLLVALNWETYGAMCLISLHKIANYVFFRNDIKRARIELMAKALKTFTDALSEETKDEFSDQVFDLKRRFFFFLLRKNLFADAFEVAQDIEDYDLYMDLFNITKSDSNLIEFSTAAFSQAAAILHEEDRAKGNLSIIADYRSESACSQSTGSDTLVVSKSKNSLKNYVPPLPSFKSKIFNAEMIKINIPKPELRVDTTQERTRAPPPPLPDIRQLKLNANTPITALNSTASSNLATLSMKSVKNFSQEQITNLNGNTSNTTTTTTAVSSLSWQKVPAQTIGIPSIPNAPTNPYVPSTAHNILPRASTISTTTSNVTTSNNGTNASAAQQQHAAVHYATPVVVTDNVTSVQRNYPHLTSVTTALPIYQPKFYQHPLVSGTIPSNAIASTSNMYDEYQKRLMLKKPTASILSNSSAIQQNGHLALGNSSSGAANGLLNGGNTSKEPGSKNAAGEKNKVKFSDTVQVAVVPEIPRKEKPLPPKRNGYSRPAARLLTNPKKELADSLPLCHPNDDYLKDFNPLSEMTTRASSKSDAKDKQSSGKTKPPAPPPSIKVVHFGVV